MADSKIMGLGVGTPKSTDWLVGVDTTDHSMGASGTNKRYSRPSVIDYIVSTIVLGGDVGGSLDATVIGADTITNLKLANMAPHTLKGNNTALASDPIDLTIPEVKTELAYGTMADQNANAVAITGGAINNTTIGLTTPLAIKSTTLTVTALNTIGVVHNDASGVFSTSLILNTDIDASAGIVDTKLGTISTAGKVSNSATTATSSNIDDSIVLRDASGNFEAGTITANLSGNATTATSATTAGTATNFSGPLGGDITGTQSATVITPSIITNAMINASAGIVDTKLATISTSGKVSNSATTATSLNTPDTIVLRDASGNLSVGTITGALNGNATTATTTTSFSGSLLGDVTGTQGATAIANDAVTNAKLANMAPHTFKGNNTASTADPIDLTITQLKAELGIGTITSGQIVYANTSDTLTGTSRLTWDNTNRIFSIDPSSGIGSIEMGSAVKDRKHVLYSTVSNNFQFYGFGVSSGSLDIHLDATATALSVVAATSASASQVVMKQMGDGRVSFGVGTMGANTAFEVFSTTKFAIPFPKMTTAQRNAAPAPTEGCTYYDLTTHQAMLYNNTAWVILG